MLRADIVKHFRSIDHEILMQALASHISEADVLASARRIVASGEGVFDEEFEMTWFRGDDLLAACCPRGLPIGNLTSQFRSNCYLHGLDLFVKRELRCRAYLRYVDDLDLFAGSKRELWAWKQAIIERLATLRLRLHERSAQVMPVRCRILWLGLVVYPTHRRIKARKVRNARRHLGERLAAGRNGASSFAALDASVQGWVNHVCYADTWGLRRHTFADLAEQARVPR